ncbi:MAG: hypothetical protein RLZZ344_283 [Pseudomonadota bacterium]|jgi:F0F1-type ATP synthase assembly protein I
MTSRTRADLGAFLGVQALVVLIAGVACMLVESLASGVSAILAGAGVVLGNGLYAALLLRQQDRPSVVWIFVGQFAKVLFTMVFLVLVVLLYASLVWPGFLVGLFSALLVVLVAPIVLTRTQKKYDADRVENVLKALSKD